MGIVYLVGAGPGDPGLITARGLELLKECDAVIYDRLAPTELLEAVAPSCKKLYVGKKAGFHSKTQEEIDELLVDCANKYDRVVRLKGGDPFVFGRAGEEIASLRKHHIPFRVVPGVTSAIAVPESVGIPVTEREVSRSVHILTGHTDQANGLPDYDYRALAALGGTLVFLMGLSHIREIAEKLIAAGKPPDTPAAVISGGTMTMGKEVRGTLAELAMDGKGAGLFSPAIIVVGDTAAYHYTASPDRLKVGVTASALLWKRLKGRLEAAGFWPELLCEMRVVLTGQVERLDRELQRLNTYQWVLFTSQNGVKVFFDRLLANQIDLRHLGNIKLAALGSGTLSRLREYGFYADFVPSVCQAEAFARELAGIVRPGERILLPRAVRGNPMLSEYLRKPGILCEDLPVYDVQGMVRQPLARKPDCYVFASASGASAFFEALRKQGECLFDQAQLFCIGYGTAEKIKEECGREAIVARKNSVDGLIEEMKERIE